MRAESASVISTPYQRRTADSTSLTGAFWKTSRPLTHPAISLASLTTDVVTEESVATASIPEFTTVGYVVPVETRPVTTVTRVARSSRYRRTLNVVPNTRVVTAPVRTING